MNLFAKALLPLVCLIAPISSFAAGPDDASAYYPLEMGNSWTYQFGDNNGTGKYEVVGYLEQYHAYLVRYSAKMIDVSIATESIIGSQEGSVINIGGTDIKSGQKRLIYGHSEVILKSPVKVGMTWDYDRDNQGEGTASKVRCKVIKIADCDVKAGHFKDVCVIQRETYYIDKNKKKQYREVHNEYYAPHVGKIKEELVEDALEAAREGRHEIKKGEPVVLMELSAYKIK